MSAIDPVTVIAVFQEIHVNTGKVFKSAYHLTLIDYSITKIIVNLKFLNSSTKFKIF